MKNGRQDRTKCELTEQWVADLAWLFLYCEKGEGQCQVMLVIIIADLYIKQNPARKQFSDFSKVIFFYNFKNLNQYYQ